MKDNLFELLLNLFEKSLTQLQKNHGLTLEDGRTELNKEESLAAEEQILYLKLPEQKSIRVMAYDEQIKLSKASHQLLMRMKLWNFIDAEAFELIINQLYFSESHTVTLQETKWTVRNVLALSLNEKQLAFLDLILYQSEDELTVH